MSSRGCVVRRSRSLTSIESGPDVPFEIRRAYWIYGVPGGEKRGGHAYRELREVIVALSGLDGAGKSFQASRLQLALEQLGFAAEVIWPPAANVLFQANPALKRRLFALLGALGRRAEPEAAKPTAGNSADSYPRPLPRQHLAPRHHGQNAQVHH